MFNTANLSLMRINIIRQSMQKGRILFRGTQPNGQASDPGDLGTGTYYSTCTFIAKNYGSVQQHKVCLKSPLIISTEQAYELIAERFLTCRGTLLSRKVGSTSATRVLKCLGFDGLVAVDSQRPKHWEVVVFP